MTLSMTITTHLEQDDWLRHFQINARERLPLAWHESLDVEPHLREPLSVSLRKFQVGESGEGRHLQLCAASQSAAYREALHLFVAEEGEHARLLAALLERLNAPLLKGHWSDRCFVLLRRVSGLKTELMILLCAEIIAKRYYRLVYEATSSRLLRGVCAQILHDEVGHVAFHCDFLREQFARWPLPLRWMVRDVWQTTFHAIALLVAWDHRVLLRACGVRPRDFRRDCSLLFDRAASQIFAPVEKHIERPVLA